MLITHADIETKSADPATTPPLTDREHFSQADKSTSSPQNIHVGREQHAPHAETVLDVALRRRSAESQGPRRPVVRRFDNRM